MRRRLHRTATKSWFMSRRRCSPTAGRDAAKSSTAPPSRRRPPGGCAAMPASSPWWMAPTASRSASGGAPAASLHPYAVHLQAATAGAASPAAPPPTGSTAITSSTGPTAGRPRSTTSYCYARPITGWCTRAGSTCSGFDDGAFRFTNPHGLAIKATEAAGDLVARHHRHPERFPRSRHRLRDRHRALARGAHRLRPCADGDDGVVGLGRHATGGWAGGRRLESVVGQGRRACGQPRSCRAPA